MMIDASTRGCSTLYVPRSAPLAKSDESATRLLPAFFDGHQSPRALPISLVSLDARLAASPMRGVGMPASATATGHRSSSFMVRRLGPPPDRPPRAPSSHPVVGRRFGGRLMCRAAERRAISCFSPPFSSSASSSRRRSEVISPAVALSHGAGGSSVDGDRGDEDGTHGERWRSSDVPGRRPASDGLGSAHQSGQSPWWVNLLNASLASDPGWVLAAFVLVDMGSALCLYALFTAMSCPVDADFALAYALSKSIRAPRLAFDAWVAGKMAAAWPDLAAVRVGLLLDAAGDASARAKRLADRVVARAGDAFHPAPVAARREENEKDRSATPEARRAEAGAAGAARTGKRAKLMAEAREMTDTYGLAYMAAKNVIGPVSIAVFYGLLRCGVDVQGALVSVGGAAGGGAGKSAGLLALASWCSTLLFPWVVLGAGWLGPRLGTWAAKTTAWAAARFGSGGGARGGRSNEAGRDGMR